MLVGVGTDSGDDPAIGFAFDAVQRRGVELLAVHVRGALSELAGDRTDRQVQHGLLSETVRRRAS